MSSKMIKCKTCDAEIASSAKVCPNCGAKNKKPIYKKWWLWGLVAIIIFIVAVSSGEADEQFESPIASDSSSSVSVDSDSATTKESSSDTTQIVETYKLIAENNDPAFTIPEKAIEFMNQHQNFFPGKSEIKGQISDYVNEDVTYAHLSKNINKYSDKLISISGAVIDIEEAEDGSLTYIHILDYDDNNYTLYYLGSLENIIKGSEVYGYALPLAMTTFENMNASYTESVTGAACYIEEITSY